MDRIAQELVEEALREVGEPAEATTPEIRAKAAMLVEGALEDMEMV